MNSGLKRATFFLGWLLSPLTSWNDAFVNIPLAYILSVVFVKAFHTDFVITLLGAYWFTNILGIAMMIAGGRSIAGNRHLGEDGDAQPQHQPQGQGARAQKA